jgi:hypothetical protein
LQGFFFVCAAYCSFALHFATSASPLAAYFPSPPEIVLQATRILFEISFPVAFMVSTVVTYVLIPHAKKAKMPLDNFFVLVPLLMHNANIVFMATEIIINKIPFAIWHFPFVVLYGASYAVFSWFWKYYKGYYFYYFMDYTREWAIVWYIILLTIAAVFFLIGYASSYLMNCSPTPIPSIVRLSMSLCTPHVCCC